MRKPTAAVSVVLLLLLSVAVAEASLAALRLLFSSILRLYMVVEVGGQVLQMTVPGWVPVPRWQFTTLARSPRSSSPWRRAWRPQPGGFAVGRRFHGMLLFAQSSAGSTDVHLGPIDLATVFRGGD